MDVQEQLIAEALTILPELARALLAGSPRHHIHYHLHEGRRLTPLSEAPVGMAECPPGDAAPGSVGFSSSGADWHGQESIPLAQIKLMIYLATHGPQTMSELAEGLDVTTPAITGLVDKLEKRDMVERLRDSQDRRVVRVRLSPLAQHIAEQHLDERRRQVRAVLATLPLAEQRVFLDTLKLLAKTLHPRGGEEMETEESQPLIT